MSNFGKLTTTETKLFLREPSGALWGLVFPPVLLVILGFVPGFRTAHATLSGLRTIDLYVPIVICFGLSALALNFMPSVLATYREKGILRRMATTPVSPSRLLASQAVINLAAAVVATLVILVVGRLVFDVRLPGQVLGFAVGFLLGAAALLAIGLFVTAVVPTARAANAVVLVLFFVNLFFAGLWLPRASMPALLRHISDFTPLGAAAQSLQNGLAGTWPQPLHLAVLAGYALFFGAAAVRLFRWE
jgi:ABC-2 type transport system permease protein